MFADVSVAAAITKHLAPFSGICNNMVIYIYIYIYYIYYIIIIYIYIYIYILYNYIYIYIYINKWFIII